MAASAKLFGKIGAALGRGAREAKGCTCGALKNLPPPGYVITSTGLIVPSKRINSVVSGPGRSMNFVESMILENMERATGLIYRFTKVIVTTGACYFAVKLTWCESTEKGYLHYYLPGHADVDQATVFPDQKSPDYVDAKAQIDDINKEKLAVFNQGCISACQTGNLFNFLDTVIVEHKVGLMGKGLHRETIADAQLVFFTLVREAASKCMVRSFKTMESTSKGQEGDVSTK